MKKIISFILALIIGKLSFCQEPTSSPTLTKLDYLKKSKTQKTIARIFTGVGAAITFTGVLLVIDDVGGIMDPNDRDNTKTADVLTYTGLVIMAGGIPFWIASKKNKRKAMSMSFKNQMIPQLQNTDFVYRAIPSLSFRINL